MIIVSVVCAPNDAVELSYLLYKNVDTQCVRTRQGNFRQPFVDLGLIGVGFRASISYVFLVHEVCENHFLEYKVISYPPKVTLL